MNFSGELTGTFIIIFFLTTYIKMNSLPTYFTSHYLYVNVELHERSKICNSFRFPRDPISFNMCAYYDLVIDFCYWFISTVCYTTLNYPVTYATCINMQHDTLMNIVELPGIQNSRVLSNSLLHKRSHLKNFAYKHVLELYYFWNNRSIIVAIL